ncbi:hypothetical protein [Paraliobacillus sp. X-1268]|uniref:hypothetical protein n=1 Tax=Paraliobacillus sp. X-1268 TaxID=2213193 RepID=UPI003515877A
MRKIMIIGSGGSGKSTLAKTLGEILDIPVYHLDAYFWKPGWNPIERSELARFKKDKLPSIRERLNSAQHAQLLEFTSPKQTKTFLTKISK